MNRLKFSSINISLGLLIIVSFFIGFYFQENSSGGAIDFSHYYNNFKLFYGKNLLKINWYDYESSSLPLYYFVTYFFYNPENLILIKIFNLFLSFFCLFLFYKILNIHLKLNNSLSFLLSSTILLSPYFRTSTFWMMEENFPILMTFITIYFYVSLKKKFSYFFLIAAIFFSVCAFFSRQNYIIVSFGLFLLIFDWNNFFSKKNLLIVFSFCIFFSPSLYFFNTWGGLLTPVVVGEKRALILNIYNIPYILNIILVYIFPFVFLEKKKFIIFFNKNKKLILFSFIFYLLIFFNFIPTTIGGGALSKLFMIITDGFVLKYLILICSFFSLLFLILLFDDNKFIIFYFLLNLILFSTITPIWQEYFDPLSLVFIILFGNIINSSQYSNKFVYFLIAYLSLFLSASILDQNYISTSLIN